MPEVHLHSRLECDLGAGSPVTGTHKFHPGVPALHRQELDVSTIRLKRRADPFQGCCDLPLELLRRVIRFNTRCVVHECSSVKVKRMGNELYSIHATLRQTNLESRLCQRPFRLEQTARIFA